MTTQPLKDDTDSAQLESAPPDTTPAGSAPAAIAPSTSGWPELDQLVETVKTKRAEEQARQEQQRAAQQKMSQDAERAWQSLQPQKNLDELAEKLQSLGVIAKPMEGISGAHSAALELSRLAKGDSAIIRVDTSGTRTGPRTTVQVQRGTQQLPAQIINSNTAGELRKTLVEVVQKLLG
ncbi:MAG: hypothetical protein ACYDCQ_04585 [Dehalococcoidia bacterium]